jgi:putative FmdB family regulatory protein
MPIYEYRCEACGHQEDHLQKISEAPLSKCPACGKKKYKKQLTAAGFQLKGSGWYATDFKTAVKKPASSDDSAADSKAESKADSKADGKSEAKAETKSDAKPEKKADKKKSATSTTN